MCTAQNFADSVRHVALQEKNDTAQLIEYHRLGDYYNTQNYDSSEKYYLLEIAVSRKLRLPLLQALAMNELCYVQFQRHRDPSSLRTLLDALNIAEDEHTADPPLPASVFRRLGIPESLSRQQNGLRNFTLENIHTQLGHIYNFGLGQYGKALREYSLSRDYMVRIGDSTYLYGAISNMGEMYKAMGNQQKALELFMEAYSSSLHSSDRKWISGTLNSIGNIELHRKNLAAAKSWFLKALDISSATHTVPNQITAEDGLADCYLEEGNLDPALRYVRTALAQANSLNLTRSINTQYEYLSRIFEQKKQYDSAYYNLARSVKLKEALTGEQSNEQLQSMLDRERQRTADAEAAREKFQNRVRLYVMGGSLLILLVVSILLWKNNRNRQTANRMLQEQKQNLESTLAQLRNTQAQLVQSEKMASLAVLTAGIAHEIQNPLNFINNFAEVNIELSEEIKQELDAGHSAAALQLNDDIARNMTKIAFHGKRADSIVKNMLQHSRKSTGKKLPTDINALVDECLRLSYHGLRARDKNFNAIMETHFDPKAGKIDVVDQEIGRVLLNLFNNAFYAVQQKKLQQNGSYQPAISVRTEREERSVVIYVHDNGTGIPAKVLDKIYQPFFTTKPTGEGTGLGLSMSYDIITKGHGGTLEVKTEEGQYANFRIELPA